MPITRIAIVDDHDLFRSTLSKAIEGMPSEYAITMQCKNGMELTEKMPKLPDEIMPHIVLTDLNMPVMDGYETTVWIKKYFHNINVIILSTVDDSNTIARLLDAGASGFMAKSITGQDVFEALEVVRNGGTYVKMAQG